MSDQKQPAFSPSQVTVVFVLGGPGAGKGTQCANLVRHYGFHHLSAGDLLRAEQDRDGSEFGALIRTNISEGTIVPMNVTIKLLQNAMQAVLDGGSGGASRASRRSRFLIDGFPRKQDQADAFEETVCPARLILFYDCPEDELQRRLLDRGKTSGRADDNLESIKKRFRTFVETSKPVIDHYESSGRVVRIDATPTPDEVFEATAAALDAKLGSEF